MMTSEIYFRDDCQLWWPRYDHNPVKCLSFVMNGLKSMDHAIKLCRNKVACVQAGGHVGVWPRRLSNTFSRVYTFEPERRLFECLRRNVEGFPRVHISENALGPSIGMVKLRDASSAGSHRVDDNGTITVGQISIDSMDLQHCDALFLDVEGYEASVLHGAVKTIAKFEPVILVEELQRSKATIRAQLKAMGYVFMQQVGRDSIYVHHHQIGAF